MTLDNTHLVVSDAMSLDDANALAIEYRAEPFVLEEPLFATPLSGIEQLTIDQERDRLVVKTASDHVRLDGLPPTVGPRIASLLELEDRSEPFEQVRRHARADYPLPRFPAAPYSPDDDEAERVVHPNSIPRVSISAAGVIAAGVLFIIGLLAISLAHELWGAIGFAVGIPFLLLGMHQIQMMVMAPEYVSIAGLWPQRAIRWRDVEHVTTRAHAVPSMLLFRTDWSAVEFTTADGSRIARGSVTRTPRRAARTARILEEQAAQLGVPCAVYAEDLCDRPIVDRANAIQAG